MHKTPPFTARLLPPQLSLPQPFFSPFYNRAFSAISLTLRQKGL
jgi:hypothetical protein